MNGKAKGKGKGKGLKMDPETLKKLANQQEGALDNNFYVEAKF